MSSLGALTCRELVEVITDYLEGTMPVDERRRFDEHLEVCADCHTYVEQMRATIQAVGSLDEGTLAPGTRQQLLDTFRDWRRSD